MNRLLLFLIIWLQTTVIYAENPSIGQMADNFVAGPMSVAWKLFNGLCYVVGVILLINAYEKYRYFRRNQQEIPISVPITYAILGTVLILIPLTYYLVGHYFSN